MTIKKMFLAAGMALTAIAFAAPAAQANVTLTEEKGNKHLEPGAEVTATGIDVTTVTASGTLKCEVVTLTFDVVTNGQEHVVLTPTGEATTHNCEVAENGAPVTITDGTVLDHEVTIDTWGTAKEVEVTFTSHIYADAGHTNLQATCHFVGDIDLQGRANDSDLVDITGNLADTNLPTCPEAVEGGHISGSFTLETEDKDFTPVTLDFEETVL